MEFNAYPSPPSAGKTGSWHMLWKAQGLLHGSDSVAIPAALLFAGVGMALYKHVTSEQNDTSIRNFLLMILLSMVPLAVLEKKLFACADPLGVLSKFSTKVLMMYSLFLSYRVISVFAVDGWQDVFFSKNFIPLVAACALLPTVFGLRATRACAWEHRDVWCVVLLALAGAAGTELVEVVMDGRAATRFWTSAWYRKRYIQLFFVAASDYTEILSFVPALWMACRADKGAGADGVDVACTQRRAVALFAFLIPFYVLEDLWNAYVLCWFAPLASAGHVAHFVLLLDFAAFILAHLHDPEKYGRLMGKFCKLVRDCNMV